MKGTIGNGLEVHSSAMGFFCAFDISTFGGTARLTGGRLADQQAGQWTVEDTATRPQDQEHSSRRIMGENKTRALREPI